MEDFQVHEGPQANFLQTSGECAWGADFRRPCLEDLGHTNTDVTMLNKRIIIALLMYHIYFVYMFIDVVSFDIAHTE